MGILSRTAKMCTESPEFTIMQQTQKYRDKLPIIQAIDATVIELFETKHT